MYLLNLWDLDDEFKQTPQISFTRLNQGFPDVELFGAAISLRIDGFWGACSVVLSTTVSYESIQLLFEYFRVGSNSSQSQFITSYLKN